MGGTRPGRDGQLEEGIKTCIRDRRWLTFGFPMATVPAVGRMGVRLFRSLVTPHLDFIEARLAARPWFAGDAITAADIMMSFPIELAAAKVAGLHGRPHTAAWLDTIHARPAYRAALAAGGPYALA